MGPPAAVAAVRSAVRAVLPGSRVLVACSGGADSLALAAAVAFEAPRAGVPAGMVTIDHGLQHDSATQAQRVAQLGGELGLDPVETVRVRVGTNGGPEAAARAARYAALSATASAGDARVLLGHTLDDQAETVLLGLGRGSGPRSIAGMAAEDGCYLRPLLGLRRSVTEQACAELGLEVWHDPHNADPRYQRVRLRTEVLPLLESVLQGGVAEALARTGELVRDDLDALDAWASAAFAQVIISPAGTPGGAYGRDDHHDGAGLDPAGLVELPRAVRTRVLRAWCVSQGAPPLSAERSAAVDLLITNWHGQGQVDLPGGIAVRRTSGRLEAHRTTSSEDARDQ